MGYALNSFTFRLYYPKTLRHSRVGGNPTPILVAPITVAEKVAVRELDPRLRGDDGPVSVIFYFGDDAPVTVILKIRTRLLLSGPKRTARPLQISSRCFPAQLLSGLLRTTVRDTSRWGIRPKNACSFECDPTRCQVSCHCRSF